MSWWRRAPRVPWVPQMEAAECGAACLAMVLAAHGCHLPPAEVRQACGVSRDGASALGIVRAARALGMEAAGVRLGVDDLDAIDLPAILHWNMNHFVVLASVDRRGATIVDPGLGRQRITHRELDAAFTGVAVLLVPSEGFQRRAPARASLKRYRRVLGSALPTLFLLFTSAIVLELVGLAFPASTQVLIDHVLPQRQDRWLLAIALCLLGGVVVKLGLSALRARVMASFETVVDVELMSAFVDRVLRLPVLFLQQRNVGDLMSRVHGNAALRTLTTGIATLALDGCLTVSYAALMLAYHPLLGGVVVAMAIVRLAASVLLQRTMRQASATELASGARATALVVEAFSALEAVKAAGNSAALERAYQDRLTDELNAGLVGRASSDRSMHIMRVLDGGARATVLWLGGLEVLSDRMTLGVFSAFLVLQTLLERPLASLLTITGQLLTVRSTLTRLDDVLDAPLEPTGEADPGRLSGAIAFEDVTYAYGPTSAEVVADLSFTIVPGEKVALVGPSGAGKSTILKLLLGVVQPTRGRVLVDGRDLRTLDLAAYRRQLGVVLQEPFFFGDTVRANLALASDALSLAEVREAARVACIDDVVRRLPQGFDTVVRDGGARFSGGQRQRLALARALAHRPRVLLLDEATSALDSETEARVQRNLAELPCTQVVIAHRLATIEDADRVLVLDGGRVAQAGSYRDLAARPGLFRDLLHAHA